jgi:hypothetical protein
MTFGYWDQIVPFLSGAICAASAVVCWFFYRAWSKTSDRLFLNFSWAFGMMAVERLLLNFTDPEMEIRPMFYAIRLLAFLLIISGVMAKNLAAKERETLEPLLRERRHHQG